MSAPQDGGPFVAMGLRRIVLRDYHDGQMIYLSELAGTRSFAISIGRGEAEEIRRVVSRSQTERPLTHQLLLDSLAATGARLTAVEVHELRRNTFFARLVLRLAGDGGLRHVDARSSDAIALALRADCPIRVAESVLEQVRIDLSPDLLPLPGGPGVETEEAGEEDLDLEDDDQDLDEEFDPDGDDDEDLEEDGPEDQERA